MIIVTCDNSECENYGIEVSLDNWDGSTVICGPCGKLLEEQAEWYEPPVVEEPSLADRIMALSPEDLDALIEVLNNVRGQ